MTRSDGGNTVESGLSQVGYIQGHGVALVETVAPRRKPFSIVLAQSAWNFVDVDTKNRLQHKYPRKYQAKIAARRAVAALNVKRADKIVCLSDYMSQLVFRQTGRDSTVVSLASTLDSTATKESTTPPYDVLVPGTITWYKQPSRALDGSTLGSEPWQPGTRFLFAGSDDGFGAWQEIRDIAERKHYIVETKHLSRQQLIAAYRNIPVTILPTALESLSFCLIEALNLAPSVWATAIPPHREVAQRIGREPRWLSATSGKESARTELERAPLTKPVHEQSPTPGLRDWYRLAAELTRT